MEPLTSGASNRIIPILKTLRTFVIFVQSIVFSLIIILLPRRRASPPSTANVSSQSQTRSWKRKSVWRLEEEDTMRRRALAENLDMRFQVREEEVQCLWRTSLFFGVRRNALFYRSWFPATTGELKWDFCSLSLFSLNMLGYISFLHLPVVWLQIHSYVFD